MFKSLLYENFNSEKPKLDICAGQMKTNYFDTYKLNKFQIFENKIHYNYQF